MWQLKLCFIPLLVNCNDGDHIDLRTGKKNSLIRADHFQNMSQVDENSYELSSYLFCDVRFTYSPQDAKALFLIDYEKISRMTYDKDDSLTFSMVWVAFGLSDFRLEIFSCGDLIDSFYFKYSNIGTTEEIAEWVLNVCNHRFGCGEL